MTLRGDAVSPAWHGDLVVDGRCRAFTQFTDTALIAVMRRDARMPGPGDPTYD